MRDSTGRIGHERLDRKDWANERLEKIRYWAWETRDRKHWAFMMRLDRKDWALSRLDLGSALGMRAPPLDQDISWIFIQFSEPTGQDSRLAPPTRDWTGRIWAWETGFGRTCYSGVWQRLGTLFFTKSNKDEWGGRFRTYAELELLSCSIK